MSFGKTALRCWLTAAALLLVLLCPLPVLAARAGASIPVTVRTDGTASSAVYTVSLTPLDNAPAPAQGSLQIKSGGTAYFTGFAFDAPGDYRYKITELNGGAAYTSYDATAYTVTIRVTGRTDGTLAAELWAVRGNETAKAGSVLFVNLSDPPAPAPAATAAPAREGKSAAAPVTVARRAATLPQTGDGFPVEALAALLCASVVGFGTAFSRRK